MSKFNLNDIMSALNKKAEKDGNKSIMFRLASEKERIKTISTGSYTYDTVIGGGIPENRITEIYGPESSGKSTLCLSILGNAQKEDYLTAYFDAENAIDFEWGTIHGVDKDNIIYNATSEIDPIFDYIQDLSAYIYKKYPGKKIVAFLDSIATLIDTSTIENSMEQSEMAVIARKMGKGLKKIVWLQNKYENLTLVCVNQTRDDFNKMKMPGMPMPKTTPGGQALKFYSSVRLELATKKTITESSSIVGVEIRVKCVKNKIAPPKKEGIVKLYFDRGFDKIEEIFEHALELKVIDKISDKSYAFKDLKITGANNVIKLLNENEEFRNEIKEEMDKILRTHKIAPERINTDEEQKDFDEITEESKKELEKELGTEEDSDILNDNDIVLSDKRKSELDKDISKIEE